MKCVALSGGVGGAKLSHGLNALLPSSDLTIIVNVGDDFYHWGLKICPDLDTVCYTLSGRSNPTTGWGRLDESWNVFNEISAFDSDNWFRLGDKDIATHIFRTKKLNEGFQLSEVTKMFCEFWNIGPGILPASDDEVPTIVSTVEYGNLSFQEYFVKNQCEPTVTAFQFFRANHAKPSPEVLERIEQADMIVFCPSNPWVSIDPILAVPGIKESIQSKKVLAVSPIVGGKAIKGPASKMFNELGIQPSPLALAEKYQGLLDCLVLDNIDRDYQKQIENLGIQTVVTQTLMHTVEDRKQLASTIINYGATL